MTQSTRRPGFRLPWSDASNEPTPDQQTTAADAPATANASPPAEGTSTDVEGAAKPAGSENPVTENTAHAADGETVLAEIDPTAKPAAPDADAATATAAQAATEQTPEASNAAAPTATPTAGAAAPSADAPAPDGDFLASLVTAMKGVVAEERVSSVAGLRTAIDDRITQLEARAKEHGEELRRRADQDLAGVDEWQKAEVARVAAEAARKVEARRQQLDQQIADHESRSTTEVESVRGRVTSYEAELEAFFAQLEAIADPAAFVAAARRMPKPPALETDASAPPAAPDAVTTSGSLNARLAELGIDRSAVGAAAPTHAESDTAGSERPEAPAAAATPDEQPGHVRDAELAGRLAELDVHAEPAAATPTPPPAAPVPSDAGEEVATAVMVKGLGSFGAITSFKQRLERLGPVRAVTLSLGPTGEFVYRATHPRDLDLGAAITTLEPGATVEKQPDGILRVTVQPR
jgi:hypothetical protein